MYTKIHFRRGDRRRRKKNYQNDYNTLVDKYNMYYYLIDQYYTVQQSLSPIHVGLHPHTEVKRTLFCKKCHLLLENVEI